MTAVLLVAGSAHAAIESDLVKQGIVAYDDLDYAKAVELLTRALTETLTREEKIATFKTLGFAHVALDQAADGKDAFMKLLDVDKAFVLDRTISPRVHAVFDEARNAWMARQPKVDDTKPVRTAVLQLGIDPPRPVEGQAVTMTAAAAPSGTTKFSLFYRGRPKPGGPTPTPELPWTTIDGHSFGDNGFAATIAGPDVTAPGIDYYAEARNAAGAIVGNDGSASDVQGLDVQAIAAPPVYKRFWFWGVVAGVLVAAGAGTAVALASRSSGTGPATIVVYPQ